MKKYLKIIIPIISFLIILSLILFFNIPRVSYKLDKENDTYYISKVYGNSKSYEIKSEYKDKPVTAIGERAFFKQSNLRSIELPDSIKKISRLAFSECEKLESINLENVLEIERNAFSYCVSLKELVIGAEYIGASAFYKCESLDNVKLLDGLLDIGSMAFSTTAIKKISIPRSCLYVRSDCFYDCFKLENINVYGYNLRYSEYLKTLNIVNYIG